MKISLATAWILIAVGVSVAAHAQNTSLLAGAAKVDVTPAPNELPKAYDGILDHLYSRAIVLESGNARAALITVDAGAVPDAVWKGVSEQVEKDLGIPARNVLLTATHTHSVPGQTGSDYVRKIVESVQMAKERLAPARVGYGAGVSYINVNRNIIDPKTRRWWEGPNYDGPSDKTVAVMKFETPTGEPIAVYYNYAMHAVTVGQLDLVSADAPGTTSKYIEDSLNNKIVALWSSGAAGDQNPIYFQQTFDLRDIRIKDYAKRGIDISNAMPPGGQGLNKKDPAVMKLMDQQKQMIVSMGQFLGEEVLHVMRGMERADPDVEIYGGVKTVSCPGRTRTNEGRGRYRGYIQGRGAGRDQTRSAADRRYCDRRGERGSVQPDRAKAEERIALRADDDGHAHQRDGAVRVCSERCVLWDGYVRSPFFAPQAGMRGKRDCQRDSGSDGRVPCP